MAKNTSKTTCATETALPDPKIMASVKAAGTDIAAFVESLGGMRCRNPKELEVATDAILLEGRIRRTSRQLDALMRKARKAGLFSRQAA
jgi:hypothetical protein